ncbi:uncharacterized protein TNCV_938501 [Trichonephila clavipes]|nr:uncharacterized protein TNCV_938501 [Trichonephila clavipes]
MIRIFRWKTSYRKVGHLKYSSTSDFVSECRPKCHAGNLVISIGIALTLRTAKSIISEYIDKYTGVTQKPKSFGKPWETLATVGPILKHLERIEAVVRFRLTTGHDFLGVFIHWLGCRRGLPALRPCQNG